MDHHSYNDYRLFLLNAHNGIRISVHYVMHIHMQYIMYAMSGLPREFMGPRENYKCGALAYN